MSFSADDLLLDPLTADPTPAVAGMVWYRADLQKVRFYDASLTALDIDNLGGGGGGTISRYHLRFSGRAYMYTDNRWVTFMDDNYGTSYYQFNESGGTGADPIDEWEHQGMPILPGTRITKVHIMARMNSVQVTDVELAFLKIDSSTTERWKTTGVDNDAEVVATEIYRGLFNTPTDFGSGVPQGVAHTGNTNDRHFRTWDFSGLPDAEFSELGEFRIYLRPVGALTATRFFYPSVLIEYEDI